MNYKKIFLKEVNKIWKKNYSDLNFMEIFINLPRLSKKNLKDMTDDEILKYSMQIAMLKQLLNKKLIDEKEYEKIKKELMKEYGVLSDLVIWREKLTSLECVALQHSKG